MAKVKVRFDQAAAVDRVLKVFKKVKQNKQMNKEIGEFVTDRIRFEARREKPLNNSRKFPNLKDSTIENRRRLAKFNATHPSFTPPKSNATITGQLLEAVLYRVFRGAVEIFVSDKPRTPYRTGPSSRQKKVITNKEVDEFLRIIGFNIFTAKGINSDPKITKRINTIVKRTLRRALAIANKL